jgi:glycosyltransferase involved in cell wall biosynthesis
VKICVVTVRSLRGSGFAARITSMLEAYAEMDHLVDLVHCRFDGEHELPSSVMPAVRRYLPVRLQPRRVRRQLSWLPALASACAEASVAALESYDVVQAETSSTWPLARRIHGGRKIAVFHDDDASRLGALASIERGRALRVSMRMGAWKYGRLQRRTIDEADHVWFASSGELQQLMPPSRRHQARTVPNGAPDCLWTVPLDHPGTRRVLFVGPAAYVANVHGLTWFWREVWPSVRRRVRDAELRIVGTGWDRVSSVEGAESVGWQPSLDAEYARARVVVAPVFAGGGTNVKVIEAMAAGRVVVTTSLGAREVPSSPGLRIADDVTSFAQAVSDSLDADDRRAEVAAANREAVNHLRWSVIWGDAMSDLSDVTVPVMPGGPR